jgi:hypothetical protein
MPPSQDVVPPNIALMRNDFYPPPRTITIIDPPNVGRACYPASGHR